LSSIGPEVNQVVFVINVYQQNCTFDHVSKPYCRVFDSVTQSELCKYALRDAGSLNGLIVGKLRREAGNRWGFHALGIPCRGRTYIDSLPDIIKNATIETKALLARSSTSGSLNTSASAHSCPPSRRGSSDHSAKSVMTLSRFSPVRESRHSR